MEKYLTHIFRKVIVLIELSPQQQRKLSDIAADLGTGTMVSIVITYTFNNPSAVKTISGTILAFLFWTISLIFVRLSFNK